MTDFNPGPLDGSVLYDQDNHISSEIWNGKEPQVLRCIPADPKKGIWRLNARMQRYVRQTGLHHLAELDKMRIDHALLTALVERWRPETNTFHFRGGEATITLEDVAYIYGLPVDGVPVIGRTWSNQLMIQEMCHELLGFSPDPANCRGGQIKLTWFHNNFTGLPKKPSKEVEVQYTRAYLFCLVASQICTNTCGSRGSAYLLELFRKFERYAWGPACLANLYRSLSKATKVKDRVKTIAGPLQLLQIWAYSRMAIGRPICRSMESIKFKYPLFKMWEQRLLKHKVLTTVEEVRQQLDGHGVDIFDWRPYDQFGDKLSAQVEERDRALFCSATMMIYYWIAERHNVDRVLKQFGLRQPVPPPLYPQSRSDERSSNAPVDYRIKMREVITDWQARHDAVINGDVDDLVGCHHDEYLQWYRRITRNQISRPPSEERDTRYEHPIQQVKRFLEWQIATLDSVEVESGPSILYRVIRRVRRKSENFRAACASNFENFNLDDCINSQSDED